MSSSYAHTVTRMKPDDIELFERQGWKCSSKCPNKPEYFISYKYVTGRQGRVTWADKRVCAVHAEKFARKHGLAFPPENINEAKYAEDEAIKNEIKDWGNRNE